MSRAAGQGASEGLGPASLALLLAVVIGVHAVRLPFVSAEVTKYLVPWFGHILEHGPIGAFAIPFSNYTPPYLYLLAIASLFSPLAPDIILIKLVSALGSAALALSVWRLVRLLNPGRALECALITAILPTVFINASMLGQCDALWAAACVAAVTEALRKRPAAMLVWWGAGIAFKAQAAFLAPFILASLLDLKAPLRLWPIPLATYAVAMVPAWLAGWPAMHLATVYLRQVAYDDGAGSASNPWIFMDVLAPQAASGYFWMGYGAAAVAGMAIVLAARARRAPADWLALAVLSSLLLPWLLPQMHERFFFLADVLSLAWAYAAGTRRSVAVAALIQAASFLALIGAVFEIPALPMIGSALSLAAVVLLARKAGFKRSAISACPAA